MVQLKTKYSKHELVSDRMYDTFVRRCQSELTKRKLTPTNVAIPILGTKAIDGGRKTYIQRLRGFVSFLMANSQYDDSLVVFYPYSPKGTVVCQDVAVSHYILSKCNEKGTPLIDLQNNPVSDSEGNPMLCIGGWKDPEATNALRSALSAVHANAHDQVGEYREVCEACKAKWALLGHGSCDHHSGAPRPVRSGNVALASLVRDTIARVIKDSDHKVGGSCHLLPRDVRHIRDYCVNTNDPFLLGIFVMLLTSIDLFLRKIEYQSLHLDNFNTNLFVMNGEYIESFNNVLAIHHK